MPLTRTGIAWVTGVVFLTLALALGCVLLAFADLARPEIVSMAALLALMLSAAGTFAWVERARARRTKAALDELIAFTRRLSEGELDLVAPTDGPAPVRELGAAFNQLVKSLAQMRLRVFQTEKLAAVGQLSATVAHEINNPLAFVIGNLNFIRPHLQQGGEDEEALKEALDGADRIAQIVRDLKTFVRSEQEQKSLVNVEQAIESAAKMAGNKIRHKARLLKNYGEVPPVLANDGRLAQVFLNLLVNAADAIPSGRAEENQIAIKLEAKDGQVVVEVSDTGDGIPPEVMARLFEPFFTTKPVGVGTGLGMSICRNIVEQAGGTIDVTSGGRGTTVVVRLPAADPELVVPEVTPVNQRLERPARDPRLKRPRVLAIDDDLSVLRALRRMLEEEYEVVTAQSASVALEKLGAGERFEAILCDLMMPEVTGIELYEHLTRAAPGVARRLIFLTGGAFTPDAREFFESLPNKRLEKPVDPRVLRASLARSIAAFEARAESPAP